MGLILNAGDAKQHIYLALEHAKANNDEACEEEIQLAEKSLNEAHNVQTAWLTQEANGNNSEISALFIHAQDHLMTSITEMNLIKEIIELRREFR
jgi:PTS system cellobiose-specific IIA component